MYRCEAGHNWVAVRPAALRELLVLAGHSAAPEPVMLPAVKDLPGALLKFQIADLPEALLAVRTVGWFVAGYLQGRRAWPGCRPVGVCQPAEAVMLPCRADLLKVRIHRAS